MKNQSKGGKFFIACVVVVLALFFQMALPIKLTAQNPSEISVLTWVNLEGALTDTQEPGSVALPMRTDLNSSFLLPGQCYASVTAIHYSPAGQPYYRAPWFYYGNEGDIYDSEGNPEQGSAGYPVSTVDWVLVSLRGSADGENLVRKAALLHSDGHVEFDGPFIAGELGNYSAFYLVIEHRNHLIVMSDTLITAVNGTITYDFRFHQSYIDDPFNYGAVGQKELSVSPLIFAMFAGNSDQVKNGNELPGDRIQINGNDRFLWELFNGKVNSYCCSDYNLNCDCNYNDRIDMEFNNCLFSSVPEE